MNRNAASAVVGWHRYLVYHANTLFFVMKLPILIPLLTGFVFCSAGPLSAKLHQGKTGSGIHPGANQPLTEDDQTTRFAFEHVNFHIDETVVLQIESLRGELLPARAASRRTSMTATPCSCRSTVARRP